MTFLIDKRRAGIIALLAMLVAAGALMMGSNRANAGVCDNEPFPDDIQFDVHGVATVGVDPFIGNQAVWVCLNPPGQESGVGTTDPNPSSPGFVVGVWGCGWYAGGGCGDTVGFTGAEVDTTATFNLPADGNTTSGASVGTGTGTCAYVNGTATCAPATTLAAVTVNEADIVSIHTPGTGCIGVSSICLVPNTGIGIGSDPGVTVRVDSVPPIGTVTANLPSECVQLGAPCS